VSSWQRLFGIVLASTLGGAGCDRGASAPELDDTIATPHAQRSDPPGGYRMRALGDDELTPDIVHAARQILGDYGDQPLGHEVFFEIDGKRYVGLLEKHYHAPGSGQEPVGEHVGVTVYVVEAAGRAR